MANLNSLLFLFSTLAPNIEPPGNLPASQILPEWIKSSVIPYGQDEFSQTDCKIPEYRSCQSHCQKNCTNYDQVIPCPAICVLGCVCIDPFIRGPDDSCIMPYECRAALDNLVTPDTLEEHEFFQCSSDEEVGYFPHCQLNCSNVGQSIMCPEDGSRGCVCKLPKIRGPNGSCILPEQCPHILPSRPQDDDDGDDPSDIRCPINEEVSCFSHCQPNCTNHDKPILCPIYCVIGCVCTLPMIRGPNGSCIMPEQCNKLHDQQISSEICPENEEYQVCGTACQKNCENSNRNITCIAMCETGCFCKESMIRGPEEKCIQKEECPPTVNEFILPSEICPENEEYQVCGTACQKNCENYNENISCIAMCDTGCFCKEPMIRGPDGKCIQIEECPPTSNEFIHFFRNVCIDDLGCFDTGPPFFQLEYRPICVPPSQNLITQFLLYTPENHIEPQVLIPTEESLKTSTLDPNLETKILIYGYTIRSRPGDIWFDMKDELLKRNSSNVIIVDWSRGNQFPYPQAVANARAVGAQVAKFINYHVENMKMDPKTVHVIGHSLGAHLAGWAGERVPSLGRITGLDPAGPWFQKAPFEVRLDATDAEFVDIIHTSGGSLFKKGWGLSEPIGHLDFYPNGGIDQPGCSTAATILPEGEPDVELIGLHHSCEHNRAPLLFLNSIMKCHFWGIQCQNYKDYLDGKCTPDNSYTAYMGYDSTKLPVSTENTGFYLLTREESPFCGLER